MYCKKYFVIILLLCVTILLHGQVKKTTKASTKAISNEKLKEYFDDGVYFYEEEDYQEALFNFLKVIESKPDNGNINYCVGMCYLNIPGEETKSIPYFEKASKKISEDYSGSFTETKAPVKMLVSMGNAYLIDNQIDKAIKVFNTLKNRPDYGMYVNTSVIDLALSACQQAKIIRDNPMNVQFTNLGEVINNSNSNRNACVNADESTMVFLSELKFYNAIFISRKVNGLWTEPENISAQLGSDGDCEPVCLSPDGNELYLVKKIKGNNDIYVATYKNNVWSAISKLNKNINSSRNEDHASISGDGLTLYFSSDRRGGGGKLDIYKSERAKGGDWGIAVNLGSDINSENNETTPFICKDGRTLYFSSDGHLTMGGYDVFISQLNKSKWEKPINAGYPVNTTRNNLFYQPIQNGEVAYTSIAKADGFGKEDIYKVENFTIRQQNTAPQGKSSSVKKVVVRDKLTNEILGVLYFDLKADSLKIQQESDKININIDEN